MEIRVGASLVLLNFEQRSKTASKNEKFAFPSSSAFSLFFSQPSPWKFNEQSEENEKKEGSENSTRMNTIRISWIKLFSCALNKLICAFADIHEYMLGCARIETASLESLQGLRKLP